MIWSYHTTRTIHTTPHLEPQALICLYSSTSAVLFDTSPGLLMIFYSFFKTLVGKEVAVELKNDVVLTGTLHSVDQYLNVKLLNVKVVNPERYPQLCTLQNCFVRGSVVRYIQIPPEHVDTELLQDACRKENVVAKK